MAQSISTEPLSESPATKGKVHRTLSRTHADYWRSRLFRRSYASDGRQHEVNDLYVRIQRAGRREFFPLTTTNQDAAAVKARDIFTFLKANGWEATLGKFKRESEAAPKLDLSVGDFHAAVEGTGKLRLRTFLSYRSCLRTIVAEAFGVRLKRGENKYDYKGGGNRAWVQRIDEVRLERLTPDRVNQWKRQRIARVGNSPAAQAAARRTVNSYLRCARSLFSPAITREMKGVKLPSPLPFAGVDLEESGSVKYASKLNAQALIAAARNELKEADPEAYKAFLLGLFAGMRKGEIDLAEWRMLDFEKRVIRLEETEWLHLKTQDSAAEITADDEFFAELKELMARSAGPFIISGEIKFRKRARNGKQFEVVRERQARNDSARAYYRCKPVFDRLNRWLRSKGIKANKPLHELRKEVGALVATQHGIYAASKFLRHSDITTTARHYADQKQRISVGLGKFLDTTIKSAAA